MKITYEEFMKLIPEETKKYLKGVFRYLSYYIKLDMSITHKNNCYFENYYSDLGKDSVYNAKLLLSTIIGLSLEQNFSSEVCKYGFDLSNVKFNYLLESVNEQTEKELFDTCNKLFCFHDDYTKYSSLLPIDIVANALKFTVPTAKEKLFIFFKMDKGLDEGITKSSIDIHTKLDMEKEITLYGNLPYQVIDYIETASRIRSILIKKFSNNQLHENEYIKYNDAYLVPISLLIAIYYLDENNSIKMYLESEDIYLEKIYDTAMITPYLSGVENERRNLESINLLYKQYWTEGGNKDKQYKDIQIIDIVNNLFDRNFTKSIAVEKILNVFNKSLDDFSNINDKIKEFEILYEESKVQIEINDFYSKINKDTKEFIIFACKAYQVLVKKVKLGTHNKDILVSDEDLVTLAMYIATHFYKTDIDTFYNYYGVTFEKIMKLLNIEVTQEEIEQEDLDISILLEKFKRYVLNGMITNENTENIMINDISLNLCSRSFNKSMLMENIFEEIRRDINLPENFLAMLHETLDKHKKEVSRREKEEYFKDLPIEDLKYLERVCQVYKGLIKTNAKDTYYDEVLVVLSLLLGLNVIQDSKVKEMFESIGINYKSISSHFKIDYKLVGELDIEILKTKFNKYMYEGRNKENNSPCVQDIALNIFNDELYKSTELMKYLSELGLSYESFEDTKKFIVDYERRIQEKKAEEAQKEKNLYAQFERDRCGRETSIIISNATYVYNRLIDIYRCNRENYKKITSDEDIEILSLIISIIDGGVTYILDAGSVPQSKTFEKYKINSKDILNYLGLPIDYSNKPLTSKKDNTLANVFSKYFCDSKELIEKLCDNKFYQKLMSNFVENVNIFDRELKTGKNYEETLTVLERITLIKGSPVEQLDLTYISNVSRFGSSLELHTAYIQNEYPKLMQSNEIETATEKIKKLVDSVYVETEVTVEPKGFLEKLFGSVPEVRKEVKLNTEVIDSLKPNIDIQIKKLHGEAQKLNELKVYMEEYSKKNKEYVTILEANLENLKKELEQDTGDDIFKTSNLNGYVIVLEERLKTLRMTDYLLKQEYVKLNQVIVNHCLTINSLVLSRSVLLPLISTEMFIGNGINTEKDGLDVTKNILTLLNDVISQDVIGTKEVLEKLKEANLTEEQLLLLTSSVNEQLNQIAASRDLESRFSYKGADLGVATANMPVISLETPNKSLSPKMLEKKL